MGYVVGKLLTGLLFGVVVGGALSSIPDRCIYGVRNYINEERVMMSQMQNSRTPPVLLSVEKKPEYSTSDLIRDSKFIGYGAAVGVIFAGISCGIRSREEFQ